MRATLVWEGYEVGEAKTGEAFGVSCYTISSEKTANIPRRVRQSYPSDFLLIRIVACNAIECVYARYRNIRFDSLKQIVEDAKHYWGCCHPWATCRNHAVPDAIVTKN